MNFTLGHCNTRLHQHRVRQNHFTRSVVHFLRPHQQRQPLTAVSITNTQVQADIHPDIEEVLFTTEVIQEAVTDLGRQLAEEYKDKEPLLLTTLAGAFMFTADLCRAMVPTPKNLQIDFPRASSYGQNTSSSGSVELSFNLLIPIKDRHVILIEDLIDTGRTLQALMEKLQKAEPASIKVVTLLRKDIPREIVVEPDYYCLEFSDDYFIVGYGIDAKWQHGFIVGFGLDYAENYRSLPYIGILKEEVYSS